ncbi:hypothetical protein OG897_06390 [Streptomyces sp. NBC_00237]|uniref:hypothetical protein n=1 Tax=Streptomyces sp. NBC_00237 TaxID=2975687 RepID=UPI00225A32D1|nr:hypothetical protein [Streptomyces sp. NBC_00237]MCX5201091.1 hypothetical protein [Streptomyces sp. NBC_00237]
MITQTTSQPEQRTLAAQAPAIGVLVSLVSQYGHLPLPYITFRTTLKLDFQVDSVAAFESWREALGIDPSAVSLHVTEAHAWLAADTTIHDIPVHISGFGVPLSPEQNVLQQTALAVTA